MKKIVLSAIVSLLLVCGPLTTQAMEIYEVKPGDTLWKISSQHGVGTWKVIRANPELENPDVLYVGQKLYIPGPNERIYKVQSGDTFWQISQKFGVNYGALIRANPQIKNYRLIYVGEPIFIPGKQYQPQQPQQQAQPLKKQQPKSNIISQYERKVVQLTNQERTSRGLQALQISVKLCKVAGIKSKDMRDKGYFSHQSPTYGSPFEMMRQFGVDYTYAGENIAAGQPTPQAVVDGWMKSPGHRKNILSGNYTHIGVGFVKGGSYGTYWTQQFIRK